MGLTNRKLVLKIEKKEQPSLKNSDGINIKNQLIYRKY
jgi:hypothetical protein